MNHTLRALSTALCLVLALSAAAFAAGEGRILGTVTSPDGKPLQGIKVTITRPGTDYRQEKVTDAKGKFTVLILDATKEYLLTLEKEGYSPYEETVKPRIGDTLRLSYTLGEAAPPPPTEDEIREIQELEGKNQAIEAFNAGVILLKNNDLNAAVARFEEATAVDADLAPAFGAKAEVLVELGRHAEALAAAERFLELEPGNVRGLRARFDAAKGVGDKEKLASALDALVAADKSRDTAIRLYNLGAEASRAGDREGAVGYLQRAGEVDPTLDQAFSALAQVYILQKKYKQAAEAMDVLIARNPGNLEALTIRYEALRAAGDKAAAKAALEAMKEAQATQNPEELYKQGVAQFNAGNNDGAIQSLELAVVADPKHAKAHYMLGLAYASNNAGKAREHLQKFLELAPKDPDAASAREMLTYLK